MCCCCRVHIFLYSHSSYSTHLTVDKIIWRCCCCVFHCSVCACLCSFICVSMRLCVQIFWYSFDDLFIDAIKNSMRLYWNVHEYFWAHICTHTYIFRPFRPLSLSLCYVIVDDMHKYTERSEIKPFELKQTRQGKKVFAQGHLSLPISAKFHLFNGCVSHIFLLCLFVCKRDLSDRYMCVLCLSLFFLFCISFSW